MPIKMPMIFAGHGSPINAIQDNQYTKSWKAIAKKIPKPEAIVAISAHWYTTGTKIMNEENPKIIYDMYGFPEELYNISYNAPGNPVLASNIKEIINTGSVYDNTWGIDHGTWSVLTHMYPQRDIPVLQISIDALATPQIHYQIEMALKSLRYKGVLLLGTGNIIHNLTMLNWEMKDYGFKWAYSFDNYIKTQIENNNHTNILDYMNHTESKLAVPTPDHFNPILYLLSASDTEDKISVYNHHCMLGSLSMTSYLFESY